VRHGNAEPRSFTRWATLAQTLLGLAALTVLAVPVRPAQACSCPIHYGAPLWPADRAVDVAVDTPLVVAASVGQDAQVRLLDAGGQPVALELKRLVDVAHGCGPELRDLLFLRPMAPLAPLQEHTLELTFAPLQSGESGEPARTRFTTGQQTRVAPPAPVLKTWLFAHTFEGSPRALNVYARADGAEPTFLVGKGMPATIAIALGPLAYRNPSELPLGQIDCAALELIDVTGETLASPRLCEPQACQSTWQYVCGTCGNNCGFWTPFNAWVGPGCPTPSAAIGDGGAPDGDTGAASARRASQGCALAGDAGGGIGALLLIPLLTLALRQRKSRRCG
jgi:hypothetical protein